MMKSISFLLITLKTLFVETFNPFEIDYCSMKCMPFNYTSSGCFCTPSKDREYITQDMPKFRQAMLDYQNDMRNKIANGSETQEWNYPSASNMSVLNYDLELEHLARCYIMSNFTKDHDNCRMTTFCNPELFGAGQNLFGIDIRDLSYKYLKMAVEMWYGELKEPKTPEKRLNLIKKCNVEAYTGHFTMLVWAKHTKVGCARAWIPNNPTKSYRYTLACNYAGDVNACTGNFPNKPVYAIGPPCSQCDKNVKCNNQYTGGKYNALCGQSIPAPKDAPPDMSKGGDQNKVNGTDDGKGNNTDINGNNNNGHGTTNDDSSENSTDNGNSNSTDPGTDNGKGNRKSVNGFLIILFSFCVMR